MADKLIPQFAQYIIENFRKSKVSQNLFKNNSKSSKLSKTEKNIVELAICCLNFSKNSRTKPSQIGRNRSKIW
jgi:hypothetical protein